MGNPVIKNVGLEAFLEKYPNAVEKYPGLVKQLQEGKLIRLKVKYKDIVYNDPMPKFIPIEDFYIRKCTELEELGETRLIMERQEYTWWEMKKLESKGKFSNIDELMYKDKDKKEKIENYEDKKYIIFECVFFFKVDEDDEEYTKIVCWWAEEKRLIVGSINFPYDDIDCYYIPYYISNKKQGFYQDGLGIFLTDNNIAENAFLNFLLEGMWINNTITPIVSEDSPAHMEFIEKEFVHGLPITANPGEIDFLQKYMKYFNPSEISSVIQFLSMKNEETTGITTSFMSGRADPVDPEAPAKKTLALLEQSGKSMKDIIITILPSLNKSAEIYLALYYQILGEYEMEGLPYQPRPEKITGENPFAYITRSDLAAKVNVQAQARSFAFDKLNEKREDYALYSILRQEKLIAENPEAVYMLVKNIIKGWSPKWKNLVDLVLPNPQQLEQKVLQDTVQAVDAYVSQIMQLSQASGQAPEFDPRQLVAAVGEAVGEVATPPSDEEIKAREKAAEGMGA